MFCFWNSRIVDVSKMWEQLAPYNLALDSKWDWEGALRFLWFIHHSRSQWPLSRLAGWASCTRSSGSGDNGNPIRSAVSNSIKTDDLIGFPLLDVIQSNHVSPEPLVPLGLTETPSKELLYPSVSMWKGNIFTQGIWKGYLFCQNWYMKGQGFEPQGGAPRVKSCWVHLLPRRARGCCGRHSGSYYTSLHFN